ncbi:MAG: tRNA lysidine(34) synthetase TilS [Rickettsiales bacterium]|jgi:dephospho-CoA kinase|nr:tRNA lysidine(34) synthetase TilS [Rickettsiales bacterium]
MIDFDGIDELNNASKILVSVSGGCDSLALTFIANEWALRNGKELHSMTIDHKMRTVSTEEANCAHELLKKHNIKHVIGTCEGQIRNESEAREIRYKLLFEYMKKENIEVLLTAHHLQDQAENFLIRLFRGSGIKGLSSMSEVSKINNFTIIRPLLNITKEYLKQYLIERNIKWYEDETNTDEKYLRNKIRNFLNSFENRDNIVRRINNEINIFKRADEIIKHGVSRCASNLKGVDIIDLKNFKLMDEELQYRHISNIIKNITNIERTPRAEKLKRLLNNINKIKKYEFASCVFEKVNNFIIVYKKKKVKVIGITGPISSGKTVMANYLKKLGYKVYECDNEVKLLYNNDNFLYKVNNLMGTIDKSEIAKIIFTNKDKKRELENLIHPIIEKKCDDFIDENINERYIFIDVPLLYEVGWDKKCDKVILITIPRDIQKDRFIKRGGNAEIFDKILNEQDIYKDKEQKSNFIIENNGTIDEFYEKIQKIKFIKNKSES